MKWRQVVFLVVVVFGSLWWASGCISTTPERDFTPQDLLVDLSVFQKGWYVDIPAGSALENIGQIDSARVQFRAAGPHLIGAAHLVFRYRDESTASRRYDRLQPSWFNSNSIASLTPWVTPGQLPYQSPTADKSRFACHDTEVAGQATVCQFMGQYEEYIVIFHTVMTPTDMKPQSYMTFLHLAHILETIDGLMVHYLKS